MTGDNVDLQGIRLHSLDDDVIENSDAMQNIAAHPESDTTSRILVIDDDEMNLLIAKKILAERYEVIPVTSGELAFKYLENHMVDLILLDIRMPKMDGFIFLTLVKENPKLKDIPVIIDADFGHTTPIFTFPIGGEIIVDNDEIIIKNN